MADMIISARRCNFENLADTSTAERAQLRKILPEGRAGWARLLRKMLGAKSSPTEFEVQKVASLQGSGHLRSHPN